MGKGWELVVNDATTPSLEAQLRTLWAKYVKQEQELDELRARVQLATSVSAILRDAGVSPPRPRPAPRRPKRDRHGMYLIKGGGVAAIVACLWRLLWSSWPRRIVTASAALAVAGGTVLTPPVQATLNPSPHHRVDRGTVDSRQMASGSPPPPRHRKAGGQAAGGVLHHHPPAPAPSSAGASSTPTPGPSMTLPPVPTPTPTPVPTPTLPKVCIKHPLNPDCTGDGDSQAITDLPGRILSGPQWLTWHHRLKLDLAA